MLSNTAVPKYYGQFRQDVIEGKIPVCEEISMEMNRIDDLIADPRIYYDDEAVEGWVRFCENELTLTDGGDLYLLDSFKLWGEQVFGWYKFIQRDVYVPSKNYHGGRYVKKTIKKRLINKLYLIVARGAAKTMFDESIGAYGLVVDTETTDGIVLAPTVRQAEETLTPLRTAITRSKGPLFAFLTEGSLQNTTGSKMNRCKLASTKKGIENFLTNSILRIIPMSIEKVQGLRPKYALIDEWLSCGIREDVIGPIEQGASKLNDYIIIASSSEGTIRNGIGDSIKLELKEILKGNYRAENVSIWWYKLDDIQEVNDPEMWLKANPNLGKTVTYDTYQQDVERAENAPSTRNDIIAKRFGIPMEGFTYFFTYEQTIPHHYRSYWKMACSLGADLSLGDDFCAFTFLFPLPYGKFGVKARAYITEHTLFKLPVAMRLKYEDFIAEGSLSVMPGTILDMDVVYDDLQKFMEDNAYDAFCIGYDPYNAKAFIERWEREHGPYGIEKVPQGAKTESVPLGEIRKLAEDRLLLFDEQIMQFTMGNCIALEDTNGNRKLYKARAEEKIDNVAALLDAFVAYKNFKYMFE